MPASIVSSRRSFLVGLPACVAGTALALPANAGAAVPISLAELVWTSSAIVIGSPLEATSHWEQDGDTRRIVTVSKVEVLQPLDRRAPRDSHLYVQTLGGRVGGIGQVVHGEASLDRGHPQVLFLTPGTLGRLRVMGMAQGHYPLRDDVSGTPRLRQSPRLGDFFVQDPYGAVARLRGTTVSACEQMIAEELDAR
jgi:hypothetical protein